MRFLKILLTILIVCLLAVMAFFAGIFIMDLDFNKSENFLNTNDANTDTESKTSNAVKEGSNVKSEEVFVPEAEEKSPSKDETEAYDFKALFSRHFDSFGGDLTYSLHIYSDDLYVSSESRQLKSASIIKLFIMEYAYNLIEKGEITKDTQIEGRSLSSLIESMITVSDNNSTNILINHFTMDKINTYIRESGYSDTILQRRMLDTAAASRGEENYTSVKDVMAFLDRLYENKNSFPESEMLDIMKRQTVSTKLRRNMPQGISMASKTGELSDTENDAGIVFSPGGDYAIVCLTGGGTPSVARDAMATICREIYDILQSERNS